MKYTTIFLISFFVTAVTGFLRLPKQAEDGKVYLPNFLAVLGIICSAVFLIPAAITAFFDESRWISALFLLFSSIGISLIIAVVNCRISYDQDGFVHKSFFGIKRKYTYDQVTAIKENTHEKYLYVGKKRLMIDEFQIGGDDFLYLVKQKYRAIHNGKALPQIYKTKHDIFNGNIRDSGNFLFAYILVSIIAIGLLIFEVHHTYAPSAPENTIEQTVSFVSYEKGVEEIILTSSDSQIFKIRFIDEQLKIKDIESLCDGKTAVTTYSTEVKPDYEEGYYSLKAVKYNDDYLLSFDEANRLHRQAYSPIFVITVILCLVWWMFVAFSIVVGRNPKKFSKRVVRVFFQDRYLR